MPEQIVVADDPYEAAEVNLWGALFTTVEMTRSVQMKIRALLEQEGDDAVTDDAEVDLICKTLDLRLTPKTGNKKASTVVKAKWKADDVTKTRLYRLLGQIEEADSPT